MITLSKYICFAFSAILLWLFSAHFKKISVATFDKSSQARFLVLCLYATFAIGFFYLGTAGFASTTPLGNHAFSLLISQANQFEFLNQDWRVIAKGLELIQTQPNAAIYSSFPDLRDTLASLPPTAFLYLDFIRSNTVFEWGTIFNIFNYLSALAIPWLAWICYRLYFHESADTLIVEQVSDIKKFGALLLILLLALLFYPTLTTIYAGKTQIWFTLLVAWSMLALSRDQSVISGGIAGLATTLNPVFGLIFLWALIRKAWPFVSSGFLIMFVMVGIAYQLYGAINLIGYFNLLTENFQHTLAAFANWLIVLILVFALCWRAWARPTALDYGNMVLAVALTSLFLGFDSGSVTLPIFVLITQYTLNQQSGRGWIVAYLVFAFCLISGDLAALLSVFHLQSSQLTQGFLISGLYMLMGLLYYLTTPKQTAKIKAN